MNNKDMPIFIYQTSPAPLLVTYSSVEPARSTFPDMIFFGAILAALLIIIFWREK